MDTKAHTARNLIERMRATRSLLAAVLARSLRAEDLFERLFRLAAAGRVNKLGAPNPWTTAAAIRACREEFFYLAGVPIAVQRMLAGTRP